MLELKIKTPDGEKTFSTNDITFGTLEQIIELEGKSDKEIFAKVPELLTCIFPDMTKDDCKYLGLLQLKKLLHEDIKNFTTPIDNAVKN